MPVRFRCVYCNQLLGIARRKAGTIVRCTNCDGQLIVPEPGEPLPVMQGVASGQSNRLEQTSVGEIGLFERNDFDDLLQPLSSPEPPNHPNGSAAIAPPPSSKIQWASARIPNSGRMTMLALSPTRVTLVVVAAVLAVGGSFLVGLLVGLSMGKGP